MTPVGSHREVEAAPTQLKSSASVLEPRQVLCDRKGALCGSASKTFGAQVGVPTKWAWGLGHGRSLLSPQEHRGPSSGDALSCCRSSACREDAIVSRFFWPGSTMSRSKAHVTAKRSLGTWYLLVLSSQPPLCICGKRVITMKRLTAQLLQNYNAWKIERT